MASPELRRRHRPFRARSAYDQLEVLAPAAARRDGEWHPLRRRGVRRHQWHDRGDKWEAARPISPNEARDQILSVTPMPEHEIGTQIVIAFGPNMPEDGDDLSWAEATIRLAKVAGPAYARRPSPHWFDAEQLADTLFYVEPADTTVREFIAGLDGCSGARAGKVAAEFGKTRTCQR